MSEVTLNTRAEASSKQPWCETCGKDVPEVLCPTCAKWWHDNPPPSPGYERGQRETVARIVAWLRKENGLCDCHARSEGECACGAWDDYKTKPLLDIATALETGEWKK